MKNIVTLAMLVMLTAVAAPAWSDAADDVREMIIAQYAQTRETNKLNVDDLSQKGSLEFWSSGGLMNTTTRDDSDSYKSFNLYPKHITVVTEAKDQVAIALFYAEGSFELENGSTVSNYRTRVSQVYIREGKRWVLRSAHYSPMAAGGGTTQTALD